MTRLIIVDDDTRILESLPVYFSRSETVNVAATFTCAHDALNYIADHGCDVVLSDIHMPRMNGVELLDKLKELEQPPIFIAMTAFDTDETMLQILAQGGSGYVIKSDKPQLIIDAVNDASNGGTALSPQCVTRLMKLSIIPFSTSTNTPVVLSSSQRDVLELLCAGCSNAEIARRLHFSEASIKKKVSSLFQSFDASSRLELVAKAFHMKG